MKVALILAALAMTSCMVHQPSRTFVNSYRLPDGTLVIKSLTIRP